ncbi:amino acid adenylation domain-containing protein [Paenibacillus sp. EKM202P]|uniref:non-ribosomal peptide synthetase n=1 Tax=unclassified Paenibacillus TaxID=185978 RepID=UPI0013EA4B10|nr:MULTISPECIES: non-ribosomal peptide synthetase [unclassified Paenibacillus]KAF6565105.1 amino acid adenylation domain-containing protein [Paenibacillus sp. EKM202P]KAF6568134.1 amino acid adenylation domain-containing protein [Paenibacillus sp. EKM207P]
MIESSTIPSQSGSDRPRRYLPLFSHSSRNISQPAGHNQVLYGIRLETRQVQAILEFVQDHQIGMPSFITSIWSVLLSHYANQYALPVVYSMISDKEEKGDRLDYPLLIHIQREDDLFSLIQRTQMDWNKRHTSGDWREDSSQQTKVDPRSGGEKDFFNVGITEMCDHFLSPSSNVKAQALLQSIDQLEIALCYHYDADVLECAIQYDGNRFGERQIASFAGHFQTLLENALLFPQKKILFHPMLTTEEREQMQQWNDTEQAYPLDKTVVQLIEEQADRTPNAIALEFGEQKLTYYELNHRANQISHMIIESHLLQGHGSLPTGTLIAIIMDRSADVLPSMLGVMKAGAAYLPVDPQYPGERLRFILEDAQAQMIITHSQLVSRINPYISQLGMKPHTLICVDECSEQQDCYPYENLQIGLKQNDLAYVIYTSGSTGKPKGTLIEHAGLVTLIPYLVEKFGITSDSRVMQFASMSFDASVYEWIGTLSVGGTLVVLSDDELPPYADISDILAEKKIHIAMLTPSVLRTMKHRELPKLRTLVSAGEPCTPDIVDYWGRGRRFVNAYGPTEVTIICATSVCQPGKEITIGKPVYNKRLIVLNSFGNPVPVGVPGELWVGGIGLARGYLNREELTRERFVHKEIAVSSEYPSHSERLYKTGDIVKWTPDGELVFIGRSDEQIKIRGYRIELGEIEYQLRQHPDIGQCVVQTWKDGSYHKLVAYYTALEELEEAELTQHLGAVLPAYMVPLYFSHLDSLPVNTNGKIDRGALPDPKSTLFLQADEVVEADEDDLEKRLLRIWRQILKRGDIGVNDHFYAVGGDSILAIQVVSMARDHGMILTPRLVAEHPTIKKLATVVTWTNSNQTEELMVDLTGEFGLTPIQQWFFEQQFVEPHYFNQSQLFVLRDFDPVRLETAIYQLIRLHPELSTEIVVREHVYSQRYRTDASIQLASYTLQQIDYPESEILSICDAWNRQLNYETGAMIYAGVIQGHPDGKARLFMTIHHLVIDGVSWRILVQELCQLYQGTALPPVLNPYKKWHSVLMSYSEHKDTLSHIEYWKIVQYQAAAFVLPVDHYPAHKKSSASSELVTMLTFDDTELLLHHCSQAYHTEINDLLLTAWSLALSDWSGQTTIAFRLEGHGREHFVSDIDLTRTIGWFTSMFPVCIRILDSGSLGATIKSVKEQLRYIPHRGMSYGALRYCHPHEEVRSELAASEPQALFNYLGQFDQGNMNESNEWLEFTRDAAQDYSSPLNHGTSLLELNCSIVHGKLHLFMKYSKCHYEEVTITQLLEAFVTRLLAIIEHCSQAEHEEFTPSDFPSVSLEQHSLDQIVKTYHLKHGLDKMLYLSPLQEGLLFHYLDHPASDQYFVQVHWKYHGRLEVDRYREAWNSVIAENDSLRTCYIWETLDKPIQCIVRNAELEWTFLDFEAEQPERQQEHIERWMTMDRNRRFDLTQPAFRLTLIQIASNEWTMIWSYHHILLDGWSLPLLLNRVHELYACSLQNRIPQRNLNRFFESYIRWLNNKDRTEAETFWRAYLADVTEPTRPLIEKGTLPDVHQPIENQQIETLIIDSRRTKQIADFVQQVQVSLNTLVQFAWGKMLQVYHDADTTIFGMVVSGRGSDLAQADRITGMLINTLPLVMHWNVKQTITEYVQQLHQTIQKLNDHSYVSLNELKSWSGIQGHAMFYSIVAFENYLNDYRQPENELKMSAMEEREKTNYPMTITVAHDGEQIIIKFIYDADRLKQETVSRLAEQLQNTVQYVLEYPNHTVGDVCFMNKDEYDRIVYDWNNTYTAYPRDRSIVDLFQEQAKLRSSQPAVIAHNQVMSYHSLNLMSQHIANRLADDANASSHGKFIGVYLPRSLEFIVSILAIMKAGYAYVPIDPDFPAERTRELIKDAGLDTILTSQEGTKRISEACKGIRLTLIDTEHFDQNGVVQQEKKENRVAPNDLAYLMYTSGSTGKPKGIMVEHRNVIRLVKNTCYFPFSSDIRLLYTGSPVFDASTFEIWGTLLNGGQLFVISKDDLLNIHVLEQRIKEWRINTLWLSSALCNHWIEENEKLFAGLQWLVVGGEILSVKHINRIRLAYPQLSILNAYGPTENTTFSTSYRIEKPFEQNIPIGKPISNSTCYILDKRGRVQPVGAVGELYVGGDGVARGYWQQNQLTQHAFTPNPHRSAKDRERGTNLVLYRTGDRVRWLPDGNIEYIGRVDDQVKLRGYRIELGEAEFRLSSYPAIKECLVLMQEVHGDLRMFAYYTAEEEEREEQLHAFMADVLPSYMLPFRYIWLKSFPLTINGKIDRKKLPLPEIHSDKEANAGPWTELEQTIEEVWSMVLKLDYIGKNEDFHTLGGHSLHALRIASLLQKSGYPVTVNQIFREQTIERLALSLSNAMTDTAAALFPNMDNPYIQSIRKTYPYDGFPLSAVQKRFFQRDLVNRNMFNVPYLALLKNYIPTELLNTSIEQLLSKHAALRLSFAQLEDDEWYQFEQKISVQQVVSYVDLRMVSGSHDAYISDYCSKVQHEFDIKEGPLWKVVWFAHYYDESQQVILLLFHHLIFDGISINIFLEDLRHLLLPGQGSNLALHVEEGSSYRDWCMALTQYAAKDTFSKAFTFWNRIVEGGQSLQVDTESEAQPLHRHMKTITLDLLEGEEHLQLLKALAVKHQTTPLSILLTALSQACFQLKNQSDLLLHVMSYQRESFLPGIVIDRTIGFFAGAYPLRIQIPAGDQSDNWEMALRHVIHMLQHVPSEGMDYFILRYMIQDVYPNTKPLRDGTHMLFHYQSEEMNGIADDLYEPLSISYGNTNAADNPSAYKLNMTADLRRDRLSLTCYYSSLHYKDQTIAELIRFISEYLYRSIGVRPYSMIMEGASDYENI